MRDDLVRRLQRHRDKLVREIDTVGVFWTLLYQNEAITRQHHDMCKSLSTDMESLEALLDILEKRDDDCFKPFCDAVRRNNPELVGRYLETETIDEHKEDVLIDVEVQATSGFDQTYLEMRQRALDLEKENEKLEGKMERLKKMKTWLEQGTKSGDVLIEHERLKLKDVDQKIQQNQRKYKNRQFELKARIANRDRLEKTVESLKKNLESLESDTCRTDREIAKLTEDLESATLQNDQLKKDLVEIKRINADSLDIADQLPSSSFITLLSPQDLNRLDTNRQFIIEAFGDLPCGELRPALQELSGTTGPQQESPEGLFNIIKSFSPDNYDTFIGYLRKRNRHHIADVLDYGGVTVKLVIKLNLDEETRRRNPIDRLNNNPELINETLARCRCDKTKFLCARLSLPREETAIKMWVWCTLDDDLRILRTSVDSRILLKQFQELFAHRSLAIHGGGFFGKLSPTGKPTAIIVDTQQQSPMQDFCPHFPYARIVRKLQTVDPESGCRMAVIGVAAMNDRVYILYSGSSDIHVFHMENSVYRKELQNLVIRGLQNPVDMVGHDGWLYVLERENELFWRLNASVTPPSQPEECRISVVANSVSVTPDGHLLLSVRGARNLMIICRAEDGEPVREISLPSNTEFFWHGLVRAQGEFIITHRCEGLPQVSLLDCRGKFQRDYSGKLLGDPVHLAVDEEGKVFVADQREQRILYFDADLKAVRILVSVEPGQPHRICFNQDSGHLLVGLANGSVEIYSVNETKYLELVNFDFRTICSFRISRLI